MKRMFFILIAIGITISANMSANGVGRGIIEYSISCQYQHVSQRHEKKMTPRQATDNLVKELELSKRQARKLLKLNEKYSDLIANPRFKGKPQPANENDFIKTENNTKDALKEEGAESSHKADADLREYTSEDMRAHIKKQHERRNAYNEELRKILTEEQYSKYTGK